MFYFFCFKNDRPNDKGRVFCPDAMSVVETSDDFEILNRFDHAFPPIPDDLEEDAKAELVRSLWDPVMKDLLAFMNESRILIFLKNHELVCFHIMKGRLHIHLHSTANHCLQAYIDCGAFTVPELPEKVPEAMVAYFRDNRADFPTPVRPPKQPPTPPKEKIIKPPTPPTPPKLKPNPPQNKRPFFLSKGDAIKEQIRLICSQYGMHAEVSGGAAYITTVAGEWYFLYNDRPIRLHHKNAEKRYYFDNTSKGEYHVQDLKFYSPLHVLSYIKNHERAEVRRLMGSPEDEKPQPI